MATILNTQPAANAINVPLNIIIQVAFAFAMDPATINDLTIILSYGLYEIVDTTITYRTDQKIAYIIPQKFLLPSTDYKLILIGDLGGMGYGVRDIAGIGLPNNYIVEFQTAPTLPEVSGLYVADGEYWIDVTGTYGSGTEVLPVDGAYDSDIEDFYAQIDVTGLGLGTHYIYVHGKDSKDIWGTVQNIELKVTASDPAGTANATSYSANTQGPFAYNLQLAPSPTAGFPNVLFTGKFTTNTAYQAEVSGIYEAEGNIEIISVDPENYDTLQPLDIGITIIFSDDLV